MSHQGGFFNTVATSGTSLTEQHLSLLKRFTNRLMVAYDADGAGWKASKRAWEMALKMGMDIKIAEIPDKFDPADLILQDKQKYVEALKNSKHIIDLSLQKVLDSETDKIKISKKIKTEVLPYIANVESKMEQSIYVKKVSESCGIDEQAIWKDLENIINSQAEQKIEDKIDQKNNVKKIGIERKILGILYWQTEKEKSQIDVRNIRGELERILSLKKLEQIETEFAGEKNDLMFEAEVSYSESLILEKELAELLQNLELDELKKTFAEIMQKISIAEKAGELDKAQMLLMECQGVSKKINNLKIKK
jgi:DNA primase